MHHLVRTTGFRVTGFTRATGVVVVVALLLAVAVAPALARRARPGQRAAAAVSTGDAEGAEDTAWVCLALVGGTALLAGSVWVAKIRRLLS